MKNSAGDLALNERSRKHERNINMKLVAHFTKTKQCKTSWCCWRKRQAITSVGSALALWGLCMFGNPSISCLDL